MVKFMMASYISYTLYLQVFSVICLLLHFISPEEVFGFAFSMVLHSTLFCLLLSIALVSGHLVPDGRKSRRPGKGDLEEKRETRIQGRKQRSVSFQDDQECQEGNPLGASYLGRTNVTASGRTCQVWSASQPHQHSYTDVGEHNYCRNPYGDPLGVYCYTTDPDKRWEHCSVPTCAPKMKVLDFSADNDQELDSNGEFTGATLDAGALPESFTVCSAFMVDAWTTEFASPDMFELLDVEGDPWTYINVYAATSYTQYKAYLGRSFFFKQTESVFFPLQCTMCTLGSMFSLQPNKLRHILKFMS